MISNWKMIFFLLHPFEHKVLFVSCCSQTWQSSGGQVVGTASMTDAWHDVRSIQDFSVSAATLLIVGMLSQRFRSIKLSVVPLKNSPSEAKLLVCLEQVKRT